MTLNSIKYFALTAAAALAAQTAAADNVAESNLAAVYQPMLNVAAKDSASSPSAGDAVSLLDGIVLDWRDPSRDAQAPSPTEPKTVATEGNVALESLRSIYGASSAN